jgi:predicted transcriptional regulator
MKSEFYELLSKDETLCQSLGRLMLVASKLEVLIKQYLRLQGKEVGERQATLGNLINLLKKNNHLTKNGQMHFQQSNMQRNYLIHNLFASFENEIERNLLPVEDLVEMDVFVYTQQVNVSIENFTSYCEIVSEGIDKNSQKDAAEAAPLL